ncbi:MAG: hypothetical protein KJ645_13440, partial [Planctomycetes bacterium]|nr:hypothetical protein [Planctomycetota bacterium]
MKRSWLIAFIIVALFTLQAVAAPLPAADPMGGTGGGSINGALQVKVVADGTTNPIAGAFVMVGPRPGEPFIGNWGFTSASGVISFNHANLTGPMTVTAGATGYTYFSLVSVNADDLVVPLKALSSQTVNYQVGDFVSGVDVNNGLFNIGDGNVDMAFVLPAMTMDELMAFDMDALFGPPEVIEILGEPYEIPSNIFLPQQYEVFVEIRKDHYYLYMPEGNFTISALSGRIPLSEMTSGGDMISMISALDWRETDIIDVTVTGDTNAADLNVDPDLIDTVTVNLANVPEDSVAFCISVGDLDGLNGLGRLVSLGLGALDAPAGGGPGSGSVTLSTTAASGKFAGMGYFPVVAVQMNQSEDLLVVANRASHGQSYTESVSEFFALPDLGFSKGHFSWNDVENPATGSPDVDV